MSNIWVPKVKILEPKQELVLRPKMEGWFKMDAVRPNGDVRSLVDWFPNLITDAGLNVIGTSSSWLACCRVGTGSTTPSVADSDLASFLAGTNIRTANVAAAQSSAPYYGSRTITYRFAAGSATGNISEVGIATSVSGGTLFSRALVLDGGGSPTTVTVLPDEALDVTYQLRVYSPTVDVEGTVSIGSSSYDYIARAASANTTTWALGDTGSRGGINSVVGVGSRASVYSGVIGTVTSTEPAGSGSETQSNTDFDYENGSYRRDFAFSWGLSAGNVGGIRSTAVSFGENFGRVQIQFDPIIPKNNTNILELVYRHAWARTSI